MQRYLASQKRYLATVAKTMNSLKQEKAETQVMLRTFFSVLTHKLPKGKKPEDHEIKAALEQLKDVHKMAGLLVLAITPGSVVTLPALCALGKRFGIEVLPSAFREDEKELIVELEHVLEQVIIDSEQQPKKLQKKPEKTIHFDDVQ